MRNLPISFFKTVKHFGAYQTTPREDHRAVEQNWVLCYKFCSQAITSSSPDFQKKTSKFVFFFEGTIKNRRKNTKIPARKFLKNARTSVFLLEGLNAKT